MKTVLVLGGSGYLGQFLVQDLAKLHKVNILLLFFRQAWSHLVV